MLIRHRNPWDAAPSRITPKSVFLNRRRFLLGAAAAGLIPALAPQPARAEPLSGILKTPYGEDLQPTAYEHVTGYNNFYEFGTDKEDPARLARDFRSKPWTIAVDGHVERPGDYGLDDLFKSHQLQERIYRFRCVEAWSMVVPWVGVPLADLLRRFQPTSKAKYVAFETLFDPQQMPGQRRRVIPWPYVEGLRLDEALHPLTLMAVGLYGEELPNQNGAPVRLVVPWKYGFKSIKSIVSIRLTETMPPTTWNLSAPREYGFYANVNPTVDHPRWSQARERPLGGSFFASKVPTLMFNGYGEEVASLYDGMDLGRFY